MMRMYLVNKRQDMNLSMRGTSRLIGMDFHHYRKIELGMVRHVTFMNLCKIGIGLEISLEDLYDMETLYQSEMEDEDD